MIRTCLRLSGPLHRTSTLSHGGEAQGTRTREPYPCPRQGHGSAHTRAQRHRPPHPAPVAQWIEQAPSKRLAAGSSPAGGASLRPPLWEGFLQVRAGFVRTGRTPCTSLTIVGTVRGRPAVAGFSRVAVSNTCRSSGREASTCGGRLGEISRGFEAPFQVRKLPLDASRVGRQEHRNAVAGPVRHLCGWNPVVQPLGQARVPVVVHAPSRGRLEDVRGQDGLPRAAPCPADHRARENAAVLPLEEQVTGLELFVLDVLPQDAGQCRMSRRAACLALGTALQVAFLVDLSGVGPLLADLRGCRVDQQLAPLVRPPATASTVTDSSRSARIQEAVPQTCPIQRGTRGTAATHGQRSMCRPLTEFPGQGPFTCGGCGI